MRRKRWSVSYSPLLGVAETRGDAAFAPVDEATEQHGAVTLPGAGRAQQRRSNRIDRRHVWMAALLFGANLQEVSAKVCEETPPPPFFGVYLAFACLSRVCLGKSSTTLLKLVKESEKRERLSHLERRDRARQPEKKRSVYEFSLCLSQACLGQKIVFIYKWLQRPFSHRVLLRSEDIIRRPIELDGVGAQHVTQDWQDVEVFEIVVVLRPAETPCASAFPCMFIPSLSWQMIVL